YMKKEIVLSLLEKLQKKDSYISENSLKKLALKHNIPLAELYGVATFYHMLHTEKQGRNIIRICNSPSCYVNGSLNLIKDIENMLKIKSGETTKDRKFSLHICSCIGCCDKAPAMMINDKVYGNLTKEKLRKILR
ncbi:MAG: NADH-quinone oxidoreductase subunit NuoE, partial [Nanoarchaeota archaeon]|nr:NADH-quinone oxidoreductase subunit NuoE [Nanoarchaeota archaeon]